jgi:chemotaxis protein methyltransferase CheR
MSAVETRPLGESDFTRFRELVQRTSGIELSEVRRSDLERAVQRTVERMSMHGPAELHAHLSRSDSGVDLEAFIAELTIGETYFFRHRAQFEALERTILPELIARRSEERRLRIWSAGCATGEEPYSLAMLLDRMLPDREAWSVMILGTDINRASLEQAQRGTYRSWSFRGVDQTTQRRYFTRTGDEHRIAPGIARMVTFSYLNLVGDAYPSLATNTTSMDLVLCRNVLIYFGAPAIEGVLGRLHDSLCDGGWLVSGPADTSANGYARFEVRAFPDAIVYRRPERPHALPPAARVQPPAAPVATKSVTPAPRPRVVPERAEPRPARPVPAPVSVSAARPSADVADAFALWRRDRDADGATERLAALAEAEPSDPWPAYLLGKVCANERRLDEALEWADRALARDGMFAPGHYLRGLILDEQGDLRAATDAVRRCVFLDPGFALGQYALAGFLGRLGETERAIKTIEGVIHAVGGPARETEVPEGDGLTAGRLLELAAVQRGLLLTREHDDRERVHA